MTSRLVTDEAHSTPHSLTRSDGRRAAGADILERFSSSSSVANSVEANDLVVEQRRNGHPDLQAAQHMMNQSLLPTCRGLPAMDITGMTMLGMTYTSSYLTPNQLRLLMTTRALRELCLAHVA